MKCPVCNIITRCNKKSNGTFEGIFRNVTIESITQDYRWVPFSKNRIFGKLKNWIGRKTASSHPWIKNGKKICWRKVKRWWQNSTIKWSFWKSLSSFSQEKVILSTFRIQSVLWWMILTTTGKTKARKLWGVFSTLSEWESPIFSLFLATIYINNHVM